MEEQGKYPVIYISFRNLEAEDWESCLFRAKRVLFSSLYREFKYIRESLDEVDKEEFDKVWSKDKGAGLGKLLKEPVPLSV